MSWKNENGKREMDNALAELFTTLRDITARIVCTF
jgi:hypothetical protein